MFVQHSWNSARKFDRLQWCWQGEKMLFFLKMDKKVADNKIMFSVASS